MSSKYKTIEFEYYRLKEPKKFKNGNIIDSSIILSKNNVCKNNKHLFNTVEDNNQISWLYCSDDEVEFIGIGKEKVHKREIEARENMLKSWL